MPFGNGRTERSYIPSTDGAITPGSYAACVETIRHTFDVLFAWPDVLWHLVVGGAAAALFVIPLLLLDRTPLTAAWSAARKTEPPASRTARSANRLLAGLVVLLPSLVVLVTLVAYFGWWLLELGWISAVMVPVLAAGVWFLVRAIIASRT